MPGQAVPNVSSSSWAAGSSSLLHDAPSENGHELNGPISGVSDRSAAAGSTQRTGDTSAPIDRRATLSQDSRSDPPLERALTGEQHNGEDQEDSPWARKTILSLDGGGVRGYSSLVILEALMQKIEHIEKTNGEYGPAVTSSSGYPWHLEYSGDSTFYPAHYFDYIAGTSTGGLAAIMLGRLRMSVEEAQQAYTVFGTSVFGRDRWFHERSLLFYPRSKYATRKVRKAILAVIRDKLNKGKLQPLVDYEIEHAPLASDEHMCRTMVVAFSKSRKEGVETHYLWRSFAHPPTYTTTKAGKYPPLNPGGACQEPIWHAARATSAAPRYFEEFVRGDTVFFDGAMGANNPSQIALKEVDQMHRHSPSILVNIGTGEKQAEGQVKRRKRERVGDIIHIDQAVSRTQFIKKWLELGDLSKNLLTNPLDIASNTHFLAGHMKVDFYRFDVPRDAGDHAVGAISLDEWLPPADGHVTLEKIRASTQAYLGEPEAQEELNRFARELVATRRRRAKTERWEKFAAVATYHCSDDNCINVPVSMDRNTLRSHLCEFHGDDIPKDKTELELIINEMRVPSWKKDPPRRRNTSSADRRQTGSRLRRLFNRHPSTPDRSNASRSPSAALTQAVQST